MKETLFLITDHFPYGTGEPFLEDELPFLSEAFDEVILLARNKGKGMRPVPANVRVVPLRKRLSLCSSLSIFLSPSGLKEMKGKPIVLWIEAMKHVWRLSQIVDELEVLLKERLGRERITLYSYWLCYGALALARIKEKYPGLRAVSRAHGYDLYEGRRKKGYLLFLALSARKLDRFFYAERKDVSQLVFSYSKYDLVFNSRITERKDVNGVCPQKTGEYIKYGLSMICEYREVPSHLFTYGDNVKDIETLSAGNIV